MPLDTNFEEMTLYKYLEWLERSRQYINCRYQGRYGYLSRGVMPTLAEYLQIKSFFLTWISLSDQ